MKTLVKVACVFAVALLAAAQARANVLVNEQFNYNDGALTNVSTGVWNWQATNGTGDIMVSGGIAYVNDSVIGNGQDDNVAFTGTHSNDALYGSFDVNFNILPKVGLYFALFKNSGSFFDPRIWATNDAGTARIGISNGANAPVWGASIALNSTHKLVFKLDQTGLVSANILGTLWVDPTSEASTSITGVDLLPVGTALVAFGLRQGSTSVGVGKVGLDNLLVGTTFGDVIPEPSTVMLLGVGLVGLLALRRRS